MPLRVHAHVSYYDDQQYHFRKPQFSTAQRVCGPANHAAALYATFRNTTTKPTVIKDPSLVGGMSLSGPEPRRTGCPAFAGHDEIWP
jgi:hypothetical protein